MKQVWTQPVKDMPELQIMGRTQSDAQGIRLFWPLSGIRFAYTGSRLRCGIECEYETMPMYAAVLVDHMPVLRFPLERGQHVYPVLEGMDLKPHEIEIVRETQPVMDDPGSVFRIISLEGDGTAAPARQASVHIEYIGDSITCGEGTVGAPGSQDWHTVYLSPVNGYMQMLNAALHADCQVFAEGGWGLYSDWLNRQEHNIPAIYERVCALSQDGNLPYDFQWQPDLVIINLGTNDASALKTLTGSERQDRLKMLETEAVAFLDMIRKRYPSAYLLWTYGMAEQSLSGVFRYAVSRARQEGMKLVGYLRLLENRPETMGAREHPGRECHRQAAERILSYVIRNKVIQKPN